MELIDKKTVRHVALLARLALNDKEIALHSKQLASILSYINKLNEVEIKGVPPTSHVLSTLKNVFRKDVVRPALSADKVLGQAPSKEGDFFKVPQVIESK